ncbi:MAG: hypothetical protein IT210_25730 [Armatimonadetes bacterium]|nr:hypothetical protein [Armatimonadota bacterium]
MLETLCLRAVADDPVMPCIERYFECIQEKASLPANLAKARVHSFLSSRPKPDLLVGQAAWSGYWPWDSPAFDPLRRFLANL